jgi:hypothetical protein
LRWYASYVDIVTENTNISKHCLKYLKIWFLLIWNHFNITCSNRNRCFRNFTIRGTVFSTRVPHFNALPGMFPCSRSNMVEMVCFLRWYCNRKYKYRHRRTLLQIFHWFVHLGTFEKCFKRTIYFLHCFFSSSLWTTSCQIIILPTCVQNKSKQTEKGGCKQRWKFSSNLLIFSFF